jgi:hypothetical protein
MNWRRTLCVTVLLGMATLPGCAYDPNAAPAARAQAQPVPPASGSKEVHMNGSLTSQMSVGR